MNKYWVILHVIQSKLKTDDPDKKTEDDWDWTLTRILEGDVVEDERVVAVLVHPLPGPRKVNIVLLPGHGQVHAGVSHNLTSIFLHDIQIFFETILDEVKYFHVRNTFHALDECYIQIFFAEV